MGRGLILVRHAMPEVVQGVSSTTWGLAESSREDCVLLAHHLPELLAPVVYTSPQPKVLETANVIALRRGLRVATDDRLREADQPPEWIDDYRPVAASYVAGNFVPGWEPQAAVARRFGEAVGDALNASPGEGDLVIVDHGLALTLFLSTRAKIAREPFWRALSFPDAWRLDLETGALERLVAFSTPAG